MTTYGGSLRPLARATCVAAGIPAKTAARASRPAAQGCQPGPIQRPRSHQRTTVVPEHQVPGPGRRCPIPKKVATSVAQSGAPGPPSGVLIRFSRETFDSVAGFLHRRRDHTPAAGPFAQIDQTTAVAAEGELRILASHRLLADRT